MTTLSIILIILAVISCLVGLLGSIVPGLPGPPFSWLGLLLLNFSQAADFSPTMLIVTALVALVIVLMDYLLPSLSTKRFGGSKYGIWGCNIGLVLSLLGLPFGPQGLLGVILYPFIGALVGELIVQKQFSPALRAAWGAFIGFLTGTFIKVVYGIATLVIVIVNIVS